MKLLALSALALCFAIVGCGESASGPDADIMAATNKVEANVQGMTCSGCTGQVCSAIENKVAGVTGAYADLKTGTVTIALEDDADTQAAAKEIETLIAGLSKGKYTVSDVKAITADDAPATDETTDEPADEQAPADDADQANATDQDSIYILASYKVKGMTCDGCSGEVEEAVKQIAGVQTVKADHSIGTVVVKFDDRFDDKVKTDEIKDLIAGLSDGKYTVQY